MLYAPTPNAPTGQVVVLQKGMRKRVSSRATAYQEKGLNALRRWLNRPMVVAIVTINRDSEPEPEPRSGSLLNAVALGLSVGLVLAVAIVVALVAGFRWMEVRQPERTHDRLPARTRPAEPVPRPLPAPDDADAPDAGLFYPPRLYLHVPPPERTP